MVIKIGQSGCSEDLIQSLNKIGIDNLMSFDDVQEFNNNFDKIYKLRLDHERKILEDKISALSENYSDLGNISNSDVFILKKIYIKIRLFFLNRKIQNLRKNFNNIITKKVNHLMKARYFLDENKSTYHGAIGEEKLIDELEKLPNSFFLLNNVCVEFPKAVYWSKHGEYVRSAQIDHVVVGPPGVYAIETKNWTINTYMDAERSPHHQASRAGFALWLSLKRKFRFKNYSVSSILVTTRKLPRRNYDYVKQLIINDIVSYFLSRNEKLNQRQISKIAGYLSP